MTSTTASQGTTSTTTTLAMPWSMSTMSTSTPSPVIGGSAAAANQDHRTSYYRPRPIDNVQRTATMPIVHHPYMYQPPSNNGVARNVRENGKWATCSIICVYLYYFLLSMGLQADDFLLSDVCCLFLCYYCCCFVLASSLIEAVCNSDIALYFGCLEGKKTERPLIIYPRKFFFPPWFSTASTRSHKLSLGWLNKNGFLKKKLGWDFVITCLLLLLHYPNRGKTLEIQGQSLLWQLLLW